MCASGERWKDGFDPEVIDLISLKPLDFETIGASVRKTHRVIIVEECMRTGIGAELTASINDRLFDELDAPVLAGFPGSHSLWHSRATDDCAARANCGSSAKMLRV